MAEDDDSDEEFARFMDENDDSTSLSASFHLDARRAAPSSKRATASISSNTKSGSASAVTAAAAVLLASSRLLGSSAKKQSTTSSSTTSKKPTAKSKSKNKSSKAKSKRTDESDDEPPPPTYTASRRGSLDSNTDPYAFDLDTSFHLESDDEVEATAKATRASDKQRRKQPEPAKRESKPVVSLEDRMALILQRTGSTNAPPKATTTQPERQPLATPRRRSSKRSSDDEDDTSDSDRKKQPSITPTARGAMTKTTAIAAQLQSDDDDDDSDAYSDDASLSDSLGVASADFEVDGYAKQQLARLRLSTASSDKFAVNTDALNESEQLTNPRYPSQQRDALAAVNRYANDRDSNSNNGGDDDDDYANDDNDEFELEQTTGGGDVGRSSSNASVPAAQAATSDEEAYSDGYSDDQDVPPFESQFDKMKELFSVDVSVPPPAIDTSDHRIAMARNDENDGDDNDDDNGGRSAFDRSEIAAVASSYSNDSAKGDDDDDGAFGYDDEDFEIDEAADTQATANSAIEPAIVSTAPFDNVVRVDGSGTEVEAAVVPIVMERSSDDVRPLPAAAAADNTTSVPATPSYSLDIEARLQAAKDAAAAAKDVVPDNDNTVNDALLIRVARHDTDALASPPMSPPPPPPPDDGDGEYANDNFALGERLQSSLQQQQESAPHHTQSDRSIATTSNPVNTVDRFQYLQSHVSALRIVTAPPLAASQQQQQQQQRDAVLRRTQQRRQLQQRINASPAWIPPPSVDLDVESHEIDAFLRRSRQLKLERQQLRASASHEAALTLRLQHAQRQILQLRRHIQDDDDDDGVDDDSEQAGDNDDEDVGDRRGGATVRADNDLVDREHEAGADVVGASHDDERVVLTQDASTDHDSIRPAAQHARRRPRPNRETHTLTTAEYAKLQKEMQTQETLIQAFQKENEQLMQQLKTLQRTAQLDVHAENEQLRAQVRTLRTQLDAAATHHAIGSSGAGGGGSAQLRLAVDARLRAEAHALALADELAATRTDHQRRENELVLALDRVKKAKLELECRYEGIDVAQLADESQRARALEHDVVRVRTEAQHALAALQKKLDWYVDNQRLLDAQDDEVRQLKSDVRRLTTELQQQQQQASTSVVRSAKAAGDSTTPTKSLGKRSPQFAHRRSPADIRRINELESRVRDMEDAMRKRHPDSLANLILASRRADDESTLATITADFERQLDAKTHELESLQAAHAAKLQSFRQQQEKLVLLFQRRIRDQEKQLQAAATAAASHASKRRTLRERMSHTSGVAAKAAGAIDNSDDVQRVRKFYTDKIKELERKSDAKLRALKRQQYSGSGSGSAGGWTDAAPVATQTRAAVDGLVQSDATTIIANLRRQLRDKDAIIATLSATTQRDNGTNTAGCVAASVNVLDSTAATSDSATQQQHSELRARLQSVETQLQASEDARAHLVATLSTLQSLAVVPPPAPFTAAAAHEAAATAAASRHADELLLETTRLQTQHANEQQSLRDAFRNELDALRAAHSTELTQARNAIAALEQQVQTLTSRHALELQQLIAQRTALETERRAQQPLVDSVPALEHEVTQLRAQLAVPQTPSMVQYRSLEMQIATLAQKHLLREAELKVLLARASQSSDLEKRELERVHQSAIAAKNVEIRHFQKQLDVILHELEQFRQPQAP